MNTSQVFKTLLLSPVRYLTGAVHTLLGSITSTPLTSNHLELTLLSTLISLGSAILAFHPILWLIGSWIDPAYDSKGLLVFGVVAGLFIFSGSSPRVASKNCATHQVSHQVLGLLILTALIRLVGQLLAVNIIGALALVIDVYTLGLWLQLHRRQRALSPFWLAVAFGFCLPLSQVVERTMGFGLQLSSAHGVAAVLKLFDPSVVQQGIRLLWQGQDILVDLPCSGAQSILWLALLFTILMSWYRPHAGTVIHGVLVSLSAAYVANTSRILALAVGLAHPDWVGGLSVMAQPWHDLIGLFSLLVFGVVPIVSWARSIEPPSETDVEEAVAQQPTLAVAHPALKWAVVVVFLMVSMATISIQPKPVDVSAQTTQTRLPSYLAGEFGRPVKLNRQEAIYFEQYGGFADKRRYGDHTVILVQTSAPLRHLHQPAHCLRGMGYRVAYEGMHHSPMPTGVYRAQAPNGSQWRVAVTFVSSDGIMTTNVSQAVWHWLTHPQSQWMTIERISPYTTSATELAHLDSALTSALELPVQQTKPTSSHPVRVKPSLFRRTILAVTHPTK